MQNINRDLAAADSLFKNVSGKSSVFSRIPSTSSMLAAPDLGFPPASEPVKRVLTIIGLIMLILIGGLILLYLVNSFFPFFAFYDNGLMAGLPSAKRYWTNLKIPAGGDPPSGLYISKDDNIAKKPNSYTVMFDLNINSSKAPAMGSYRHILHRGSDDYNQEVGSGMTQKITGNTSSDSSFEASMAGANAAGGTPLPIFMNPGIFLHPYRNDLLFFFQTEAAQKSVVGYDVLYLESVALDDIPLREWFRITVVLNGITVDVYKNGELLKSIILKGEPRTVPGDWYGRSGPIPAYGVLQNIKLWNGALNPKQVKDAASIPLPAKIELAEAGESCEA
jgi:hypothetical protein